MQFKFKSVPLLVFFCFSVYTQEALSVKELSEGIVTKPFFKKSDLVDKELLESLGVPFNPEDYDEKIGPVKTKPEDSRRKVAIYEDFIWTDHELLKGNLIFDEREYTGKNISDDHGTFVAGIIAQISPNCQIIAPVQEDNYRRFLDKALRSDAPIINISWSLANDVYSIYNESRIIRKIASSGKIFVVSAGNHGGIFGKVKDSIDWHNSLIKLANDPELKNRIVIAGNCHKNGILDEDTNTPCKEIEECFITAPGTDVQSATCNDINDKKKIRKASGTSYSAPAFCGVFLRLFDQFRDLTGDDVRDSIFKTANKETSFKKYLRKFLYGENHPNPYGQGIINYKAAYDECSRLSQKKNTPFMKNIRFILRKIV